jgi:stress-induced-phosphoprotein 1
MLHGRSADACTASDNDAGMGIGKMFQDPQMWSKLEANPKTAALVRDPAFRAKLSAIQADPSKAASAFSDPNMIAVMGVLMGIDLQAFERPEGSSAMPGDAGAREEEAPKPAPKPTPKAPEPKPEPPKEEDSEEAQAKKAGDAAKARGNALYVKRDFAGASEQYKAAWEAHKDIVYLSNLAACQFETGAYDECIKTCEEALEHGSETRADYKIMAKAYARIGSANVKKEDLPTAIRFFQKSLTEHRTADTLAKLQAAEKQLKENERRAYIDPAKSEEERNRGNDLYKKGDFAGAVAAYTEAIKRAPEDSRGYTNRSVRGAGRAALDER